MSMRLDDLHKFSFVIEGLPTDLTEFNPSFYDSGQMITSAEYSSPSELSFCDLEPAPKREINMQRTSCCTSSGLDK